MDVRGGHRRPGHGTGLGGAHLVMREDQVGATTLDVETGPEVVEGDGGALDVPSRASRPERRGPAGLAGAREPPQQAIQRVAFPRAFGIPAAFREDLGHALLVVVADLSESWCAGGVEVPVGMLGILDLVDQSGGQQLLDELHHARDGLDCPHVVVRWDDAQGGHVGPEQLGLSLGELLPVLTRRLGPLQQRIIHVRDVLDIPHRQAEIPPGPVH